MKYARKISAILFFVVVSAMSQGDAYLKLTDYGASRVRIAVPPLIHRISSPTAVAETLRTVLSRVLRDDLKFSPFLEVLDSALFPQHNIKDAKDIEPFSWANLKVQAIVLGQFDSDGRKVALKMNVVSVSGGAKVFKKDYEGNIKQARRLVHRISDDIHKALTGEEGVAQTQIAFVSTRWGGTKELFVCDYDGYAPRRLTQSSSILLSPDWSSAGDRISYTSYKNDEPDIYIYDIYKDKETILVNHPGPNLTASWSPDDRFIVYSKYIDANSELVLRDIRSGEETRLTYTPYSIETSPCFSSTGREIAFTSDRSGTPQIYIMDIYGANVRRITFEGNYNDCADWSPKGDKICYASQTGGAFQIAVIDLAYGQPIYLTSVGSNENPYWSSDGYHIVFTSNRSGRYQIYTMNWDGSDVRRITEEGSNTAPAWSPRYRWSFD